MKTSISIKKSSKKFGDKTALSKVSIDIQDSGVTAILGKNGAGKSTLIRCCLGLETLDSGSITLLGHNAGTKKAKQHTGAMLQETQLPENLTVKELITLFAGYYFQPFSIEKIISLSQTLPLLDQRYQSLSGGQKRCVQFAIAIAGNPEILFLDEPSAGLDNKSRQLLWKVIANFAKQGKTIILTTHYIEEAEALAKRIVLLKEGGIEHDNTKEVILSQCQYDFIRCRCNLDMPTLHKLKHCIEASFSEGFVLLRTEDSVSTLRDLLSIDTTVSQLTVQRPTLTSILRI